MVRSYKHKLDERVPTGMQLAVFGATGRTGRPLVQQALDWGHDVVAFARSPSDLSDVSGERLLYERATGAAGRAEDGQLHTR